MATSKSSTATKTTKAATKKAVQPEQTTPALSPAQLSPAKQKKAGKPTHVKLVTSFNLKRTIIQDGVKANMFLEQDDYVELGVLGMKLQVTWDEVVRGCINSIFASSDPLSALKHFVPALQ